MAAHGYFLVRHWRSSRADAWFTSLPAFCRESNVAWMRISFTSPQMCLPTHKGPSRAWLCLFPKDFGSHINPGPSESSLCQSGQGWGTTTAVYPARSLPGLSQHRSSRATHFISCITSQEKAQVSWQMQCPHPTAASQCSSGQNEGMGMNSLAPVERRRGRKHKGHKAPWSMEPGAGC